MDGGGSSGRCILCIRNGKWAGLLQARGRSWLALRAADVEPLRGRHADLSSDGPCRRIVVVISVDMVVVIVVMAVVY